MTAKGYLERVQHIDMLIKNKTAEKERYRELTMEITTSVTPHMSSDKVQSSGSKQKMADAVESCIDYERKIDRRIAELTAERDAIIETIEQLPMDKYDLLHLVYVQYKTLKEAAAIRHESYSWVTTNHGIALKMIDAILKERKATKSN